MENPTKQHIARSVKRKIDSKGISARKLADVLNMHHPQIHRVTAQQNYNIDTLLKILDALDLEIEIKDKIK